MASKRFLVLQCKGRSDCRSCELRDDMVCSDVTMDELVDFHTQIDDLVFPAGSVLFNQGAPADGVYCIRSGAVKLIRYGQAGSQRIVRVLKKGDVAGMEAVLGPSFEHAAIAVGEVRACRIGVAYFRHMVEAHPALQHRLMQKWQEALQETEDWLAELAGGSASARVRMARLLLRLRDGASERIYRFNVEDVGAMLGLTMETVSRILADLRRQGILTRWGEEGGRFYRADIVALESLAAGEGAAGA